MHKYDSPSSSLLWDGRFSERPSTTMRTFGLDESDRRLLRFDVEGSIAHATMLGQQGVVTSKEADLLRRGLEKIQGEVRSGTFAFQEEDEDVHSAVERRLGEIEGLEIAGKLHTGRSRNDQVATDLRLFLLEACRQIREEQVSLLQAFVHTAKKHTETVVPAYTHLQQAQAVPLAHVLLAYAWMIFRDLRRFDNARERIDQSPLGAGACGGSSIPLAPQTSASLLGFSSVFENSIDAIASRDFASEFAFCCTQGLVHLSRLSEDLILWSSKEFGWIRLPDSLSTGSSMLPQKKNPDIAELVRGKCATVIGQLTGLLVLQKGLPLSYNRDLQEDKKLVFAAFDPYLASLGALRALIESLDFKGARLDPGILAIDLAERLVLRGLPFREAHRTVGALVRMAEERGIPLDQVDLALLRSVSDRFESDDLSCLRFEASVKARTTHGGGSSSEVQKQLDRLQTLLSTQGQP